MKPTKPLFTRKQAEKLVKIIQKGSLESGVLVMLSLSTTLQFKRKVSDNK